MVDTVGVRKKNIRSGLALNPPKGAQADQGRFGEDLQV